MNQAISDAAALGATVTVAAGDNGSSDNASSTSGVAVDFPASSPYSLACGGTTLMGNTSTSHDHVRGGMERAREQGGRGRRRRVRHLRAAVLAGRAPGCPRRRPAAAGSAARPSPAAASPTWPATPTRYSGYQVVVDGKAQPIGGTSAVAPLWAGLIARLAQASGTRFGLLQPLLYAGITPGVAVGGLPRHRRGQQRRLQGRPGLGRLHRSGVAQRDRAAGAALPHHQPHASPDHRSHRPDRSRQRARFVRLRLRRANGRRRRVTVLRAIGARIRAGGELSPGARSGGLGGAWDMGWWGGAAVRSR